MGLFCVYLVIGMNGAVLCLPGDWDEWGCFVDHICAMEEPLATLPGEMFSACSTVQFKCMN